MPASSGYSAGLASAIRDLKGRRVGIPGLGSPHYLFLSSMAAYVGLDPRVDITWLTHDPTKSAETLAGGQVDALIGFPPVPQELRAKGIGHDETGVGRENLARHLDRGGEEQSVAMRAIILPFLVGAEVRDRGLDLDDPDFAARIERHQIGAAPGRQRQFADNAAPVRMQEPRGAPRNGRRSF